MRNLIHIIIAIAALGAAVVSCGHGDRDYSRWVHLSEKGWAYGDTVRLVPVDTGLPDNDSTVIRPLYLGIAHSNDYPYSNLWIEVTYHGVNAGYRDTVNITLSDVYGRWLGSGFGASYQHEVMLSPHADIDLNREVEVRHIMRVDTLRGIDMIGIAVR